MPDPSASKGRDSDEEHRHQAGARRIIVNSGFRAIADIGSKLAVLALFVVIARGLGASAFGAFTLALTIATLSATLAKLGQQSALTRAVARDRAMVHDYLSNTICLQLVLAMPVVALATLGAPLFGVKADLRWLFAALGIAMLIEALIATVFAVYQAYERLGYLPIVLITQRWLSSLGGIAAILLGAGVEVVGAIYLAGAAGALLMAWVILTRRVVRIRWQVDRARWLPLLRAALPIGIAGVFNAVLFRIDTAMLAAYEPADIVGNYSAAYRGLESTLFLSWAVAAAVYPVFARLSRTSQPPVSLVFERSLKLALAASLPVAAGAMILAEPLVLVVFGDGFPLAAGALVLLGPAIALYPLAYLSAQLIVATDHQRLLAPIYATIALQNILTNLVLIPVLSLDGAALSTAITQVLLTGVLLVIAVRTSGTVSARRIALGPALATLAGATAMLLTRDRLELALVVGPLVYIGTLYALERRLFPEDVRVVRAALRRRDVQSVLSST
ncbi:MAG: flippase [Solirubrobacteraceae bacterium MAG38_C4-C5]|nr:flippase [Candidatus Siliceabacter maunaloa]